MNRPLLQPVFTHQLNENVFLLTDKKNAPFVDWLNDSLSDSIKLSSHIPVHTSLILPDSVTNMETFKEFVTDNLFKLLKFAKNFNKGATLLVDRVTITHFHGSEDPRTTKNKVLMANFHFKVNRNE